MKLLYITQGDHLDYQDDCLLIGLKELFGADVTDCNKRSHLYTTFDESMAKNMYGRGMTVTRVLPDLEIDRSFNEVVSKIKNKYFEYIIFGSVWRNTAFMNECLACYPVSNLVCIDGEDHTLIHHTIDHGVRYFKRELYLNKERILPISFGIPTTKFNPHKNKSKDFAHITPLDVKTYIYENEKDYYQDYRDSRFATTTKKAGWDAMRHYEILGNGCIPYFLDIEKCPVAMLGRFPKQKAEEVRKRLDNKDDPKVVFEDNYEYFAKHTMENNTTESLAKYLIDSLRS